MQIKINVKANVGINATTNKQNKQYKHIGCEIINNKS